MGKVVYMFMDEGTCMRCSIRLGKEEKDEVEVRDKELNKRNKRKKEAGRGAKNEEMKTRNGYKRNMNHREKYARREMANINNANGMRKEIKGTVMKKETSFSRNIGD